MKPKFLALLAKNMQILKIICILCAIDGTASAQESTVEPRLDPANIMGKWIPIEPSDKKERWGRGINWIHFLPGNKIEWSINTMPESKPVIRRGSYTIMLSGNLVNHSTKRVLIRIDPTPSNPAIAGDHEDGSPIFLMDLKVGSGIDSRFYYDAYLLKFRSDVSNYVFTKSKSEQAAPSNR